MGRCLAGLAQARAIKRRVAAVGFVCPQVSQVLEKLEEGLREIRDEIREAAGHDRLED